MKIKVVLIVFVLSILSLGAQTDKNEYYLKLNKAFEIYGAVFKELTSNYVVGIDPEKLMEKGIEGMLNSLDPYTVYIPKEESKDVDIIITGSYTGLGIIVSKIDSMLTVTGINSDSKAKESGLRVGDRIYSINTTVILHEDNDKLREFTNGKQGTVLNVSILRDGLKDTLDISLTLSNININSIFTSKMLPGNIGYIKLTQFSRNTVNEFRNALFELRKQGDFKGLIIDVRENPGGLLVSAVELCELFLPEGTPIVSTKGKDKKKQFTYSSINFPIDTLVPLVVLINNGSASASEILAGALQDLDRAVIVGENSYGKGLVQSVTELPFDNSLKITTAKYYMPSGRCIQLLDYPIAKDNKGLGLHYDSVFYTKNKRVVYESSGIKPDIFVASDSINDYQSELFEDFHFFKFANIYSSAFDSLDIDFQPDEIVMNKFKKYLTDNNFSSSKGLKERLKDIESEAIKRKLSKNTLMKLNSAVKSLNSVDEYEFTMNIEYIKKYLKIEILRRFYTDNEIYSMDILQDKAVREAIKLFQSDVYQTILSTDNQGTNN